MFLGITNLLDVFCGSILTYLKLYNTWIYNLLILIQVPYFIWLFVDYLISNGHSDQLKKLVWIVTWISMFNFIFFQGPNHVNNFSYLLGMSVLTVLIIKYYYNLLTNDSSKSLFGLPLFWLSIGIVIFFTASFPILAYLNIIIDSNSLLTDPLYDLVGIGNIFLSLSYLMVVLCPLMIPKS